MNRVVPTVRDELRQAGIGDAVVAVLLLAAFYSVPLAEGRLWIAALVLVCAAGLVPLVRDPKLIRTVPLLLVAFVAVYAVAGLQGGLGGGSDVARYLVRPVAIGALALWMLDPGVRRRALVMVLVVAAPQVLIAAAQAIDAVVEYGRDARVAADSVTGSLGDSEANTLGLVSIAGAALAGALGLAGVVSRRNALIGACVLLSISVFAATRAAVVFVPLAAVAMAAGGWLALRGHAPRRPLLVVLLVGVLSVPVVYGATEGIYPGSFVGTFSNQGSELLGDGSIRGGDGEGERREYRGPRGVGVLPGRTEQIRIAADISTKDGPATTLLGRGFGSAAIPYDAVEGTFVPEPNRTGVTWVGRLITETGWLGLLAFLGLLVWLTVLGIGLIRRAATAWDRALGYLMPGFAALTLGGGLYTTVLDVRAYSALFIVLAAATIGATRLRAGEPAATDSGAVATRPEPAPVGAPAA